MKKRLPIVLFSLLLLLPCSTFGQWRKLQAFSSTFLNEVFFFDNNHGWITGFNGTIIRTTDGGNSWSTSTLPGSGNSANRDICFVSNSTGFISGEDGIWKSVDGGANWTNITPNLTIGVSSSHWFIDGNVGVFGFGNCSDSTVTFCSTTNGGTNWTTVTYVNTLDVAVGGMTYVNGTFYAAGGNGKVWQSSDGGLNWTVGSSGSGGWQEDLVVAPGGGLFTASANGSSCGSTGGGKVMRSTDGGATWAASSFPSVVMWGVSMYSASEGWSAGDGGHAFKTTDGGATWSEYSCGMSSLDRVDDIHFTDATHGWAVGDGIYKFVGLYYTARPDTIDFGDVLVGTSSRDTLARIKAIGPAGSVDIRQFAGPDASQFGATGGLSGAQPVAACSEATTPIHFSPTSEGIKVARFDYIVIGRPDTPHVYLRGRGVAPHIASSETLTFDSLVCANAGFDTLVVVNSGTYTLRISGVSFGNMTGGSFQLVSPAVPIDIPPSAARNIVLQVIASGPGVVSGQVILTNSDLDPVKASWKVQLSAYRRSIIARLSPDSLLTIPSGPINTPVTGCLNYINGGDGTQKIESVTPLVGPGVVINTPIVADVSLFSAGQQSICFQVTANDTGWIQRRFKIRTQPCGLDTFVTVRYYARNPIIAAPGEHTLPGMHCDRSQTDTIVVTNNGNAPLILQKPGFTGVSANDFSITSPATWPDTIPIKGALKVVVAQSPGTIAGPKSATLSIPSNDLYTDKSPWKILLHGAQEVDSLWLSKKVINLGDLCRGGTTTLETIGLLNGGTTTGTILSVMPDLASQVAVDIDPTGHVLAAGAQDSLRLRVTPASVGPFQGHVVVSFGECGRQDTITIVGTVGGFDLAAPPLTFGGTRIGAPVRKTVPLVNNSATPATVTALRLSPSGSKFTIISPTPSFQLLPGTPVPVTIEFQPTDTLPQSVSLVATVAGGCNDSLLVPITGQGLRGDLLPTRSEIRFATLLSCSSGATHDSAVVINHGTVPLNITGLSLASGGTGPFQITDGAPPLTILPGDSIPIVVDLKNDFFGDVVDTLIIQSTDPNQSTMRIPVVARRERVELTALDSTGRTATAVAFDTLYHCIQSRKQILHLLNTGTVTDTVRVDVAASGVSVTPRFVLVPPSVDTTIAVSITLTAPGELHDTLRISSLPCSLLLDLPIEARFARVAATLSPVDFQDVPLTKSLGDSTYFVNTGDIGQTIESAYIEGTPNGFSIDGLYGGKSVDSGGRQGVAVRFAPDVDGPATATLVIVTASPCHDTLRTTLTGAGVKTAIFIDRRKLDFGARIGCADTCAIIAVQGLGPKSVTISSIALEGANAGAFTIEPIATPYTLQKDSLLPVRICFSPAALQGKDRPTLVVNSDDSARPRVQVLLDGILTPGLTAPSAVSFGTSKVGLKHDTTILVHNLGSSPITIDSIGLPEPFRLVSSSPITIPPGDSVPVTIGFTADSAGSFGGAMLLHQNTPCGDSLLVALDATGKAEELSRLSVEAGHSIARWGTTVPVPVTLRNLDHLRLADVSIAVTANPRLLDPRGLRARSAGRDLQVERISFDPTDGTLKVRIRPAPGDSAIAGDETSVEIDYAVLRGDTIETAVVPRVLEPSGATIRPLSVAGDFTLEDFCDAYGRRLRADGVVALKAAVPNPATSTAEIEFEVPFAGQVRLGLYDSRGEEILRPVDEYAPAGRRRIVIDVSRLPSGVYTYRLTAGLQTLTERMVVTK